MQDRIVEFALAEGQKPLGTSKDKFAKEMTFPTPFFENTRDDNIAIRLSYQKTVQWELFHCSGDFYTT